MRRRTFLKSLAAAAATAATGLGAPGFRLNYVLASAMYGQLPLAEILPEVKKTGATAIDLWPKVHGAQREEIEAIGHEKFAAMLSEHGLTLGGTTRYDRGPLRIEPEIEVVRKLGGKIIVTGSAGNAKASGDEQKAEIAKFAEKLKPIAAKAVAAGITLAIENHARALIQSPDSLRRLAEVAPAGVGIAFAPYHLPQQPAMLAQLLRDIGPKLALFYAWERGQGSTKAMPAQEALQQLPGRGPLDFAPLLRSLREIGFTGPTEIFMHPTPRGRPILPTAAEVTAEIIHAREHLDSLVAA